MVSVLSVDHLYKSCDLDQLDFTTTADLDKLSGPFGQERALEAIEFGVDIKHKGFHLFALGPPGVGKHELVNSILRSRNTNGNQLYDWCYVNNFDDHRKPLLLKLEAGMGHQLSKNMLQLVEDIVTSLPSAFQNEEYHSQRQEIEEVANQRYEQAFSKLSAEAKEKNITLIRTPGGFSLGPVNEDGVISPEEFTKLPKQEQERIEKIIAELQLELQKVVSQLPLLKREASHQIQELNEGVTRLTIEQFVAWLENEYRDYPEVIRYLAAVKEFAIENAGIFLPQDENSNIGNVKQKALAYTPFRVNVIVDNTDFVNAPVVFEDHPTYQNLVGRVEYISEMGNMITDLTLIRAGALHRANGGYLILEARKLLSHLYAWEGLKRALKSGEVKIASLQEMLSLGSTLSLEPESVPISVKVILLGEPQLYYLLNEYDPEFGELFNVAAEFAGHTDRTTENLPQYAQMIATLQQQYALCPLDRAAVGRLVEHASRVAADSDKLSLDLAALGELMKEADHWASKRESRVIGVDDIEKTINSQRRRHDYVRERLQEQITRQFKLIDTEGRKIAQVNALSVLQLGDHAFGSPTRISATARLGSGKVIDIERETKLGGDIHSKGVMIISAYLANKYAREQPLPLAASLVFEQSYGGVDGDSASCAEVCVLLSAIGNLPLRQDLAVTGSMNQLGEVQAIGGVNQKVEGFFDLCQARGLSGHQGVIIPAANQVHLMLDAKVRDAVAAKQFHIYTATHVEQVMAQLSTLEAGIADSDGVFTEGGFNRCICDRLAHLQGLKRQFSKQSDQAAGSEHDD